MNVYTAVAIINVGIMILIGTAVYFTKSGFPLFGLIFLMSASRDKEDV